LKGEKKMKKILTLAIIVILCLSTFSILAPQVKAEEIVWNTNPTPLPVPLTEHASVVYNGKIYVLGGNTISWIWLDTVYLADILPDGTISGWTTTTPLPQVRGDFEAVAWNGFIYVLGGSTTGGVYLDTTLYAQIQPDGTLGGWMTTTSLPTTVAGFASAVWNGRIYVIVGGWPGWKDEVYFAEINPDGSIGSWNPTSSLPAPRRSPAAIVRDSVIYVIGGQYGSGTYHDTVYYATINPDGSVGSWSTTNSIPVGRENAEAVLSNDDIYVIGGNQRSWEGLIYDTIFRATINPDGTIQSWTQVQDSLPEPRMTHTSVVFEDIIYVLGGVDTDAIKDTVYYSEHTQEIQLTFGAGSDYWPSIVQDSDGKIWLIFISDRTGNRALYIKSSVDGGETWTSPQMLAEDDLSTIGVYIQRPSIMIDSSGTMWIAWQSQRTIGGGDADIWYITSTDEGTSWSIPEKSYVGDSPWNGYYDPFIIEAFGKIWIFFQHYSGGRDRIWCFSSDDEGSTWSSRTGVTSETNSRGHASAILVGTELWLVYDSAMSSSPSWPEADIYLMKTTDGVSWSPEQQVTTVAGTEQFPSIVKDTGGAICVFFDYTIDSERSIQYTYSLDDGTSWLSLETLTTGFSVFERSPGQTAAMIDEIIWVVYAKNSKIRLKYVSINQPPVADFRYRGPKTSFTPSKIYVTSEVKFDAEPSYDLDGSIVSYAWDFGDETIATEEDKVTYHTYNTARSYTVTLTVTDNEDASSSVSKDIVIHPWYWELFIEIDYIEGYMPSAAVTSYIERYFRDNGIVLTTFLDDEIPFDDDGVTEDDFWTYEGAYNDMGDDKAWYDIFGRHVILDSKWKWVLFGTWYAGDPNELGHTYTLDDEVGNYVFIADGNINGWAALYASLDDPVTKEELETAVLMHEIGHCIGILLNDKHSGEKYDSVPWSVMSDRSIVRRCNADPIRYSPGYWKLKDLEYYEI